MDLDKQSPLQQYYALLMVKYFLLFINNFKPFWGSVEGKELSVEVEETLPPINVPLATIEELLTESIYLL